MIASGDQESWTTSSVTHCFCAYDSQDFLKVVNNQHVSFTRACVHASPGDPLCLEPSMGNRDVSVVIPVPDVHRHNDVV
jgi:hypothetical protein